MAIPDVTRAIPAITEELWERAGPEGLMLLANVSVGEARNTYLMRALRERLFGKNLQLGMLSEHELDESLRRALQQDLLPHSRWCQAIEAAFGAGAGEAVRQFAEGSAFEPLIPNQSRLCFN